MSPRDTRINCKTPPIQHDDVGLIIPLIPHLRIPAQEPRRQRTLLEHGEFWALSYTWSLPPSSFLTHFETQANDTMKQAKACISSSPPPPHHCLHQTETDTRGDTASTQTEGSDRHLSVQQMILILTSRPRSHF